MRSALDRRRADSWPVRSARPASGTASASATKSPTTAPHRVVPSGGRQLPDSSSQLPTGSGLQALGELGIGSWGLILANFHPLVQDWFSAEIGEPTAAQRRGWESIRAGRHTLIAAPTGSGKTLAAFLTALDDLSKEALAGPLPDEVRVLYVSLSRR